MKKNNVLLLALLSCATFQAQDKIQQAVENLQDNYNQEKVYLLLCKSQYIAGEDLRFKAFVLEGYNKTSISTSLLVELYDSKKNLLEYKTISLKNGEGDGSFTLNKHLEENVYYIRAYTPWMANFSEEFQLIKEIPIYNPESPKQLVKKENGEWTVKAFPESGTFMVGVPTNISVRLFSEQPPQKWNGYLIDAAKPTEKLVNFQNLDSNVALLNFTPKKGIKYQIIVQDDKAKKQKIDLPLASDSGVALQVNSDAKGIHYKLVSVNQPEGLKNYKIVGTVNNAMAYRANISNNVKDASSTIPARINNENNGVLQLSIFNDKDEVVAQRLSFIKPANLYVDTPEILDLPLNNNPRAFNSFDIVPTSEQTHFSVLVKDVADPTAPMPANNLLSSLWLTGDFSSPINRPSQYFTGSAHPQALDALLISEKWNRFQWKEVLKGELPQMIMPTVTNLAYQCRATMGGRELTNATLNLVFKTQSGADSFTQVKTDANGNFLLGNIYFEEPVTVYYYLNSDKSKGQTPSSLKVEFNPLVRPVLLKGDLPKSSYVLVDRKVTVHPNAEVALALQNMKNEAMLQQDEIGIAEVQIEGKKKDLKKELDDKLSSGMFKSINSTVFDFVNEEQYAQSYPNIMQWLQGKVAGLTVQSDGKGNLVPYIRNSPAKIYLDEIPTDTTMINGLPVSNIAMVKVLKGAGLLGDAVAIYTRRGDMKSSVNVEKEPEKMNKADLKVYDKAKEFILPDFFKESYQKIKEDTREVLYWNPVLTDDSGMAPRAKFFNNDRAQDFEITVIGFDKNDKPIFYNQRVK
ncbi:hypothetical protein [Elizabethkingia sp. JS20170427COW]|uniref:hypothetical protein n=1 Tax=Elizabethkingia sp. JS20170427COW TaxID=2583851 RepID=UPI0011105D91|nr:hypothetical protein [Elizabethkingia sp. JS20170427COW]QCX53718.1 hypothetical protein FGE20_08255 [Elizabethkingia sp. JS20170427COW]